MIHLLGIAYMISYISPYSISQANENRARNCLDSDVEFRLSCSILWLEDVKGHN
jgi:hypothetical protein